MNYTNPHLLWSVDDLKSRLSDPKLVLMDMRPPEAYANGHIPGARSFDIFGISLIDTRPQPLEAFLWMIEHLIQAKGVNNDSTVVAYDDIAGMRSARLFWFLEFFGHHDVHVLNGGFNAWQGDGLETVRGTLGVGHRCRCASGVDKQFGLERFFEIGRGANQAVHRAEHHAG